MDKRCPSYEMPPYYEMSFHGLSGESPKNQRGEESIKCTLVLLFGGLPEQVGQ